MNPPSLWAALFLLGTALTAGAQAPSTDDPASWLGLTPEATYTLRGAPSEVFTAPLEDSRSQVVHFYPDHSYLYWSANHVWQVRLDRLWTGPLLNLTMGMERVAAEAILGPPLARGEAWSVWNLPYQTFPKRLRLVFTDGSLADAYFYRSEL